MLRRRVETAELKIAELRATNDYLLSQNTQFRLQNAAAVAAAAAVQRGMATATVTTVSQPQATVSLDVNLQFIKMFKPKKMNALSFAFFFKYSLLCLIF